MDEKCPQGDQEFEITDSLNWRKLLCCFSWSLKNPPSKGFQCYLQHTYSVGATRVLPLLRLDFRKFLSGWGCSWGGRVPDMHQILGSVPRPPKAGNDGACVWSSTQGGEAGASSIHGIPQLHSKLEATLPTWDQAQQNKTTKGSSLLRRATDRVLSSACDLDSMTQKDVFSWVMREVVHVHLPVPFAECSLMYLMKAGMWCWPLLSSLLQCVWSCILHLGRKPEVVHKA